MKGCQDRGRSKGKEVDSGNKKRFKPKDRKIAKCYGCRKIDHWKRDCRNRLGNTSSANVVQFDDSYNKEELLCVSLFVM